MGGAKHPPTVRQDGSTDLEPVDRVAGPPEDPAQVVAGHHGPPVIRTEQPGPVRPHRTESGLAVGVTPLQTDDPCERVPRGEGVALVERQAPLVVEQRVQLVLCFGEATTAYQRTAE